MICNILPKQWIVLKENLTYLVILWRHTGGYLLLVLLRYTTLQQGSKEQKPQHFILKTIIQHIETKSQGTVSYEKKTYQTTFKLTYRGRQRQVMKLCILFLNFSFNVAGMYGKLILPVNVNLWRGVRAIISLSNWFIDNIIHY